MTTFVEPPQLGSTPEGALMALARLEATSNAIRVRISRLAPDQLYRTVTDEQPIVELISQAVDREREYLDAFQQIVTHTNPRLAEPSLGVPYLDRDFSEDLAEFFDLRRETLTVLRSLGERDWERTAILPDGTTATARDLAIWLQRHDERMLRAISGQRQAMARRSGVDELLDMGVAGKLGPNIAQ